MMSQPELEKRRSMSPSTDNLTCSSTAESSSFAEALDENDHDDLTIPPLETVKFIGAPLHFDGAEQDQQSTRTSKRSTYRGLLATHREFSLFFCSYVLTAGGEWMSYLASIAAIQSILGDEGQMDISQQTSIGILVFVRLLPGFILAPFGGVLADSQDKRKSMVVLDVLAGLIVLMFVTAYRLRSITTIYVVTFLQQAIAMLYEPCRSTFIPLLVTRQDYLDKALTLVTVTYSLMSTLGAAFGGFLLVSVGIERSFICNSVANFSSAILLWLVKGKWNVSSGETSKESPWRVFINMNIEGVAYLRAVPFGPLVLIKASNALLNGASDVLYVSFSERPSADGSAQRLSVLFAAAGFGCLVGPLMADICIEIKRPRVLQLGCIAPFALIVVGYIGSALFQPFWVTCFFIAIRSAGNNIIWLYSSLLFQKLCDPAVLGRVSAFEYGLATLAEALSALLCGKLQDTLGLSVEQVSLSLAVTSWVFMILWLGYHFTGRGVAAPPSDEGKPKYSVLSDAESAIHQQ